MRYIKNLSALALASALVACGGGGVGGGTGQVQISGTDAPVDNAKSVVVKVSSVDVKPKDGEFIRFTLDQPKVVDLLQFTDGLAFVLLPTQSLPSGDYEWLRLNVVDNSVNDSFVVLNDESVHPLKVPSDKLRLIRGFTVPDGGLVALTVDFDLRKALVDPSNADGFFLKPVLRVVENDQVGLIQGSVAGSLITAQGVSCTGDPATGSGYAVYVYSGANVTPDDLGSAAAPLVSTHVKPAGDGVNYTYTVAYLPAGSYTVAFTCQAKGDDPEIDDAISFVGTTNATVVAGQTTTLDLPQP